MKIYSHNQTEQRENVQERKRILGTLLTAEQTNLQPRTMWLSKIVKSPRDSACLDCSFNTNLVMVIKSVLYASAEWSISCFLQPYKFKYQYEDYQELMGSMEFALLILGNSRLEAVEVTGGTQIKEEGLGEIRRSWRGHTKTEDRDPCIYILPTPWGYY